MSKAKIHTLTNGSRLMHSRGTGHSVYIAMVVFVGFNDEIFKNSPEICHCLEHVLAKHSSCIKNCKCKEKKCSKSRKPVTAGLQFERIGCLKNAYTTDNRTVYHITTTTEHADSVLSMFLKTFLHQNKQKKFFTKKIVSTELNAVRNELTARKSDKWLEFRETVSKHLFASNGRSNTLQERLKNVRFFEAHPENLVEQLQLLYQPQQMMLQIFGNVSQKTLKLARSKMLSLPKEFKTQSRLTLPKRIFDPNQILVRAPLNDVMSRVDIVMNIPCLRSDMHDVAALKALGFVLAGSMQNSRLLTKLRVQSNGLVYSIPVSTDLHPHDKSLSYFTISLQSTDPRFVSSTDSVMRFVFRELTSLKNGELTSSEQQMWSNVFRTAYYSSELSNQELAEWYLNFFNTSTAKTETRASYFKVCSAVDAKQIATCLQKVANLRIFASTQTNDHQEKLLSNLSSRELQQDMDLFLQ